VRQNQEIYSDEIGSMDYSYPRCTDTYVHSVKCIFDIVGCRFQCRPGLAWRPQRPRTPESLSYFLFPLAQN